MDIRQLLNQLADDETALCSTQFLAPCVKGGRVRTRMSGLIYTFTPTVRTEGWGIFQPLDAARVEKVDEPLLSDVERYLQHFPVMRLRLVHRLRSQSWLAYPANAADARQRLGEAKPVVVHLVTEGGQFDQIVARWDGTAFWLEIVDRRADFVVAEKLNEALLQGVWPADLRFKGLTPEMRTAYDLAAQQLSDFCPEQRNRARLTDALKIGGGELKHFQDQGEVWQVEWLTPSGEWHSSAISKADLTVISAGICLDGGDRAFDLQSLVGVVEHQWQ